MSKVLQYQQYSTYDFIGGPARAYIWNDQTAVVISETLATRYDDLRKTLHLVGTTGAPTLVPEIVFSKLSLLPIPALATEIIVQGLTSNDAQQVGSNILGKLAADSTSSGRMVLPATLQESQLEEALLYGWTRLCWFEREVEAHYFEHAAKLEDGVNAAFGHPTAVRAIDDWALHLVHSFILSDDSKFASFIELSPLRAVFIAKALESLYEEHSDSLTDKIAERIRLVGEDVIPLAQRNLNSILQKNMHDEEVVQTVFRLMLVLNPPEHLTLLPITSVDLSYEPHNNKLLSKLGAMPQLVSLDLSDSMLSREGTDFLKNLTNLRKLDISNTRVMSSSLRPFSALKQLEELNLSGTQINDMSLGILSDIKSLKRINVTDTQLTNVDVLRGLMPLCEVVG